MLDFSHVPLVDNHCHSLLRRQPQTVEQFRACFSESYFSEMAREHVEQTVFYQWALRELGELYQCEPVTEAILTKCNTFTLAERTQNINRAANIGTWLVDFGYSTTETFGQSELQQIAEVQVNNVLRLEPLIEQLIFRSTSFDDFHAAYVNELQELRTKGYIALKSILAYRTGLDLRESSMNEARSSYADAKQQAIEPGKLRVADKPFLDYLIPLAVEIAAQQEFPIQFHTGFGDPDQNLLTSNPALLRPLFSDKYRGAKLVLLHAGYPYTRELSYLVSVYPNVFADFGLAIPFVTGQANRIVRELLSLGPASKILYSSDAFHIPELYYLGAVLGRRAVTHALSDLIEKQLLTRAKAEQWGEMMLRGNAERVYF